jgi:hypothetical protein
VSNETDKTDNCPVTINYINKYLIVLQIVHFYFCWQADNKYYKKKLLICINKFIYLKKIDKKKYKINLSL